MRVSQFSYQSFVQKKGREGEVGQLWRGRGEGRTITYTVIMPLPASEKKGGKKKERHRASQLEQGLERGGVVCPTAPSRRT